MLPHVRPVVSLLDKFLERPFDTMMSDQSIMNSVDKYFDGGADLKLSYRFRIHRVML